METKCLKEQAIIALRSFNPKGKNDVINIIDTILNCYVKPLNQSNEENFLIEELKSFIDGIKKNS